MEDYKIKHDASPLHTAPYIKTHEFAGRIFPFHFRLIHARTLWSGFHYFHETLYFFALPFGHGFDRVIAHVAHPAGHTDPPGAVFHMGAKAHILYPPLD